MVARVWPGKTGRDRGARRRHHEPQLQGDPGRRRLRAADRGTRHGAARHRPERRARGVARGGGGGRRPGGGRLHRAGGLPRDALHRRRGHPARADARPRDDQARGALAPGRSRRPGTSGALQLVPRRRGLPDDRVRPRHGGSRPPTRGRGRSPGASSVRGARSPSGRATTTCSTPTSSTTAAGSGSSTGSTRAWATRSSTWRTSPSTTSWTPTAAARCSQAYFGSLRARRRACARPDALHVRLPRGDVGGGAERRVGARLRLRRLHAASTSSACRRRPRRPGSSQRSAEHRMSPRRWAGVETESRVSPERQGRHPLAVACRRDTRLLLPARVPEHSRCRGRLGREAHERNELQPSGYVPHATRYRRRAPAA